MSALDNCPSSEPKGTPESSPAPARDVSAATGKTFWRSMDEMIGTTEFRDFVEREFPAYASELLDGSRRHFLKVMGASLALAGVASIPGCRRPDHRILAFNTAPEDSVPGEPLFYATAMQMPGGGCQGLLAETFDGRPTKVEGNPLHPRNKGKSTIWAQASVLGLYDPERSPASLTARGLQANDFAAFATLAESQLKAYDQTDGAGLAFMVEKATSPSRDALKTRIMSRWPKAAWHVYDAVDRENTLEGARIAFGRPVRETLDLKRAKLVVSLDRDFLGGDCDPNVERDWAAARFTPGTKPGRIAADSEMSRLYVVETEMTLTGGAADHRLPLRSGQIASFAVALGAALVDRMGGSNDARVLRDAIQNAGVDAGDAPREWIDSIAEELASHRGECVLLVGERQDPAVHALAHAINSALGNVGRTVSYRRLDGDAAMSSLGSIRALASSINSGAVSTLMMIGGNPVFDAPADLDFATLLAKVKMSVYLGEGNETAAAAKFFLPRAHYLEAWGDVQDWDGTYSVVQPMTKPIFGGVSELEMLAAIAGIANPDGYEIVRDTVASRVGVPTMLAGTTGIANPTFETRWRRCLHDGVLAGTEGSIKPEAWGVKSADIGRAMAGLGERTKPAATFDVIFSACPKLHDGRWATNAWLQELPQQITKTSWDNPALVSRKTAKRLGLNPSRHMEGPLYNNVQVVSLSVGGKSIEIPIWVQPGIADDTVVLHVGHGRRSGGLIAEGEGVDVYPLRTSQGMSVAPGESITPAKGRSPFLIANTQDHWAIEGRDIFREIDLYWWKQSGDEVMDTADAYGNKRHLDGAERLGIEAHAPVDRNVYKQAPGRGSSIYYYKVDDKGHAVLDAEGRKLPPDNKYAKPIQQWGMSIDLTTCTGCGACTVACQAENNIPVVGKPEVAKGREMHWIRVDRYYSSESMDEAAFENPDMVVQPVPCMHCEQAPCEVVCPVSATTHGRQGTNDMAYNRCIGTRYCSNNCPYKVRRFNFFDYGTKRLEGTTSIDAVLPEGVNKDLVPPRLREKDTEVQSMQHNPHVTVRSRGVMEKCTYCIQRINKARMETKLSDLSMVPDGFFQSACQQACPTDAIIFGDIYDYDANGGKGSRVYQAKADPRTFAMLGYLNIRPRTTYQLRVRNPNERLRPRGANPFEHGGHGGGHETEHESESHGEGHVMSLPVLSNLGVHA